MGWWRQNGRWKYGAFLSTVSAVFVLSCCGKSSDSPLGPSITIGAPTILRPSPGTTLTGGQITLVVGNANVTDGAAPTYTFQVATDSAFTNILAQADTVAQGEKGQTSWKLPIPLGNLRYFWRARARVDNTEGPFSFVADFDGLVPRDDQRRIY